MAPRRSASCGWTSLFNGTASVNIANYPNGNSAMFKPYSDSLAITMHKTNPISPVILLGLPKNTRTALRDNNEPQG